MSEGFWHPIALKYESKLDPHHLERDLRLLKHATGCSIYFSTVSKQIATQKRVTLIESLYFKQLG